MSFFFISIAIGLFSLLFVLYIVKRSMDQEKHLDNLKKKMEERLTAEQEKSKRTKERYPESS
jgi:hypothetical protein